MEDKEMIKIVEKYERTNLIPRDSTKSHLEQYKKYINMNAVEVLDIGCVGGGISIDLIEPLFPTTTKVFSAVDKIREAINIARKKNKCTRSFFLTYDIINEDLLPAAFKCRFDQVFSLHCLQWIHDQKTVLRNIASLLTDNGQAFLTYLKTCPMFNVQDEMAKSAKWSEHFTNVDKLLPLFLNSVQPLTDLVYHFDTDRYLGYHTCRFHKRIVEFPSVEMFTDFCITVNQFVEFVPIEQKDEYVKEYIAKTLKHRGVRINDENGTLTVAYEDMVILAYKK